MKIIEYEEKYLDDVKDLLVELEEYILSIDDDELDQLHPEYRNKMALIDLEEVNENNGKVYLSAFRTNKEYENQGYFSKLYKFVESNLKSKGFKSLTLGVEPKEIRNIQIYFNWGFTKYIKTGFCKYANGEVAIVNYYEKELN